jgi:hypothetical protein
VRPEMRRAAGVAVAVTALAFSSSCWCKWWCKPTLTGDIVSGKPKGSALVKVLITLTEEAGVCTPDVTPPRVIVFPGSAIRWRVNNGCRALRPNSIGFTQPTPVPGKKVDAASEPKAWNYNLCTSRIDPLYDGEDKRNVLFCEVPDNVHPGVYKYGLEGGVRLDPEIEVRPGG